MARRTPRNALWLRRFAALIACAAAVAAAAPAAQAGPVKAKATPLAVYNGISAGRCPTAGEVDGARYAQLLRAVLRKDDGFGRFVALTLADLLPTPAAVLCDPALTGTSRPLGPFGGATYHELNADTAYPGLRALGTPSGGLTDSELVPGDRLELPPTSAGAVLSLVVATANGAQVTQVGPLGADPAVAARIEGTLTAPSVVIEHASGALTRSSVTPPAAANARVVPKLRGRRISFSGTAAPRTLVSVSVDDDERGDGDAAVSGDDGRFNGLTVAVGAKRRTITVSLLNLPRRQALQVTCTARWNQRRKVADRVRCKQSKGARGAQVLAPARAATRPVAATPAPSAPAPSAAWRPVATAAKLRTVEASVSTLARHSVSKYPLLVGDVNGDGRPEVSLMTSNDDRPAPALVVSRASGRGVTIPIRVEPEYTEFVATTIPDLDGDGRDEVTGDGNTIITDLLAAPALPARVDLRMLRPTSPRDLDLGIGGRGATFSGLLTTSEPLGSVADTTGDGRPEVVLGFESLAAVFPSQAVAPGISSRLAQVFPIAWLNDITADELRLGGGLGGGTEGDAQALAAIDNAGVVTIGGRVATLTPADPAVAETAPRTFLLRTYHGGTEPVTSASFSATGIPQLLDYDPASGDFLVALFESPGCRTSRCLDRVLRIGADGALRSSVATRRSSSALEASFITDGADGDPLVDVAIWRGGGGFAAGPVTAAGEDGTVAVLASAQAGGVRLGALPVLARAGRPVTLLDGVTTNVLPNGSRWLAGITRSGRTTASFATISQQR